MNGSGITRRERLGLAGLAIGAAAAPALAKGRPPAFFNKADFIKSIFKDLRWNCNTYARVKGDLDPGWTPPQLPALKAR
jgi:hypothetical protein